MVPITSGWPAWPISTISRPRLKCTIASRWTLVTSGQVASIANSFRRAGFLGHGLRHAVGGEDHRPVAIRHLVEFLDEHRALLAQRFDHVFVVNDFVADIDRRAVFFERALDRVDRPHHARAKAARRAQQDAQRRFFGGGRISKRIHGHRFASGLRSPYITANPGEFEDNRGSVRKNGRSAKTLSTSPIQEILPWPKPP